MHRAIGAGGRCRNRRGTRRDSAAGVCRQRPGTCCGHRRSRPHGVPSISPHDVQAAPRRAMPRRPPICAPSRSSLVKPRCPACSQRAAAAPRRRTRAPPSSPAVAAIARQRPCRQAGRLQLVADRGVGVCRDRRAARRSRRRRHRDVLSGASCCVWRGIGAACALPAVHGSSTASWRCRPGRSGARAARSIGSSSLCCATSALCRPPRRSAALARFLAIATVGLGRGGASPVDRRRRGRRRYVPDSRSIEIEDAAAPRRASRTACRASNTERLRHPSTVVDHADATSKSRQALGDVARHAAIGRTRSAGGLLGARVWARRRDRPAAGFVRSSGPARCSGVAAPERIGRAVVMQRLPARSARSSTATTVRHARRRKQDTLS